MRLKVIQKIYLSFRLLSVAKPHIFNILNSEEEEHPHARQIQNNFHHTSILSNKLETEYFEEPLERGQKKHFKS